MQTGDNAPMSEERVVIVTGGARRIGAGIVQGLHAAGMRVVLHYRDSAGEAEQLAAALNARRGDSVILFKGDLEDASMPERLVSETLEHFGRLDALVNNASAFYPTPVGVVTEAQWEELFTTNLKAPFFLCQAAAAALVLHDGCIVNIADVHGERPMRGHSVYCMSKAGLVMMTRSLARELGPAIRVNAVAPGPILWPEAPMDDEVQSQILSRTSLERQGRVEEIADAVLFLIRDASYSTGEVLHVDGGRHLYI